jgi:hypothetical protein
MVSGSFAAGLKWVHILELQGDLPREHGPIFVVLVSRYFLALFPSTQHGLVRPVE